MSSPYLISHDLEDPWSVTPPRSSSFSKVVAFPRLCFFALGPGLVSTERLREASGMWEGGPSACWPRSLDWPTGFSLQAHTVHTPTEMPAALSPSGSFESLLFLMPDRPFSRQFCSPPPVKSFESLRLIPGISPSRSLYPLLFLPDKLASPFHGSKHEPSSIHLCHDTDSAV